MKPPLPNRMLLEPAQLAVIDDLRGRVAARTTSLAVSTMPETGELLTLLLRCRTRDEVRLLAFAFGLRAGEEGGRMVLANRAGDIAAQAWLFD